MHDMVTTRAFGNEMIKIAASGGMTWGLEKAAVPKWVKVLRAARASSDTADSVDLNKQIQQASLDLKLKPRYLEAVDLGGEEAGASRLVGYVPGKESPGASIIRKAYKTDGRWHQGDYTLDALEGKEMLSRKMRAPIAQGGFGGSEHIPEWIGHSQLPGKKHVSFHEDLGSFRSPTRYDGGLISDLNKVVIPVQQGGYLHQLQDLHGGNIGIVERPDGREVAKVVDFMDLGPDGPSAKFWKSQGVNTGHQLPGGKYLKYELDHSGKVKTDIFGRPIKISKNKQLQKLKNLEADVYSGVGGSRQQKKTRGAMPDMSQAMQDALARKKLRDESDIGAASNPFPNQTGVDHRGLASVPSPPLDWSASQGLGFCASVPSSGCRSGSNCSGFRWIPASSALEEEAPGEGRAEFF